MNVGKEGKEISQFVGELLAFDKPYGMSYSGNAAHLDRPQFDRLIQDVKVGLGRFDRVVNHI